MKKKKKCFLFFFTKQKTDFRAFFFTFYGQSSVVCMNTFWGSNFLFSMEKLILYYNTPDGRDQTDFGPGVYLAIAHTDFLSSSFAFDPLWGYRGS